MSKKYVCRCRKCGKATLATRVTIKHRDFTFCFFKDGGRCATCARKDFVKQINKFFKDFPGLVALKKGEVKVNWDKYFTVKGERKGGDETVNRLDNFFEHLGILSYKATGNWEILSDGLVLNPQPIFSPLYFTKKADAIRYTREEYGGTMYDWELRQIGEVLTKEEVLESKTK